MMVAIDIRLTCKGVPAGCGLMIQWNEYDIPQLDFIKMPRICIKEELHAKFR